MLTKIVSCLSFVFVLSDVLAMKQCFEICFVNRSKVCDISINFSELIAYCGGAICQESQLKLGGEHKSFSVLLETGNSGIIKMINERLFAMVLFLVPKGISRYAVPSIGLPSGRAKWSDVALDSDGLHIVKVFNYEKKLYVIEISDLESVQHEGLEVISPQTLTDSDEASLLPQKQPRWNFRSWLCSWIEKKRD